MIVGIEHVAIASPDPKKLAQWYVDALGFKINYDSGGTFFVKAANGSMIEIITAEGVRGPQTLKDPGLPALGHSRLGFRRRLQPAANHEYNVRLGAGRGSRL